jgi:hypothetical protein
LNRLPRGLLVGLALLLAACAPSKLPAPQPPAASPAAQAISALGLRNVAVGPIAYAVDPPGGACSAYVVGNLHSSLEQKLQRCGYSVVSSSGSLPRPVPFGFPPQPGVVPPELPFLAVGTDALLLVWLEEYWESSLCEWTSPKYLTVGVVGVLYAGLPPVEVWRQRARIDGMGSYQARELITKTSTRLADVLLGEWPIVPKR